MAFNNNPRQNNKINTTTKVVQMYNPTGEDAGTLTLGFWNTYATIKINPILDPKDQKDGKVYDYETSASVVVNAETITTLNKGIALMEAQKKAKKDITSVAVKAGSYVIKVGPTSDYEGMGGEFYVGLFEVNDKNVATGSMFYPFVPQDSSESTLLIGWDEDNGKSKTKSIDSQWLTFKNFLKLAETEVIMGGAHGTTSQLNIWINKLTTTLELMKSLIEMASLGGRSSGGSGSSSTGQTGGFGTRRRRNVGTGTTTEDTSATSGRRRGSAPASAPASAPSEEEIDDISDIENEMDELVDLDDLD